jgi:21S rRNA (GM2251-2'-O)-methyltransferase
VVLKSAAGAAEEVTIFTVNSPVEFLQDSRAMGWKTYSAVAPPEKKLVKMHGDKFISTEDIEQTRPLDQDPCILVLGNEGHGLPRLIKVATEFELSVPKFVQSGSVDSLNVSVAAGLLCHSFVKETTTRSVKEAGLDSQPAVQPKKASPTGSDEKFF